MPIWRLQTSFAADTTLPRDRVMFTPHFNDSGVTTDPQQLCVDLATALAGWTDAPREITVKAYDAQGTVPVFPQGEFTVDLGLSPASSVPREIAVCLSYFSGQNRARFRGRLYAPALLFTTPTDMILRPSVSVRSSVAALAPIFADLGGPDVDWVLYSRADDAARSVSNWWIDDEWDIIRSRGLRPTERTEGTVDE